MGQQGISWVESSTIAENHPGFRLKTASIYCCLWVCGVCLGSAGWFCAGLTWGLSRSCDKMMPGGGSHLPQGPEDRWPLHVTSRLPLPHGFPTPRLHVDSATEKLQPFCMKTQGSPRVAAEAFPGLSRGPAQTHLCCFLTAKRSWASQGEGNKRHAMKERTVKNCGLVHQSGPWILGLAWKEEELQPY